MKPAEGREEILFQEALQSAKGLEREAFLDKACAGNEDGRENAVTHRSNTQRYESTIPVTCCGDASGSLRDWTGPAGHHPRAAAVHERMPRSATA
jgi:hypothetical protein